MANTSPQNRLGSLHRSRVWCAVQAASVAASDFRNQGCESEWWLLSRSEIS
jgi:hypothetical protein